MKTVAKTVKSELNEYNEWQYHKGAKFMEIELSSCKTYLLSIEDVLNSPNWDLTKEDLLEMDSASKSRKECVIKVSKNRQWLLIKK